MNRKILPVCLVMAMLLSACGQTSADNDNVKPSDDETSAVPEETTSLFVADELPTDLSFGGKTVKICIQENRKLQFDIEEATGDIVEDSIYQARQRAEERLNLKIEYVPYHYMSWDDRTAYMNQVGASILSGSNDFDILGTSSFMSQFMLAGYITDMSDAPYIDLDKPWWSTYMAENTTIDGVLPFVTGDISIGGIKSMMSFFKSMKSFFM